MLKKTKLLYRAVTLILVLMAFSTAFYQSKRYLEPAEFDVVDVPQSDAALPWFHSGFVSTGITRIVHAPSGVEISKGDLRAFWFAGSREGGRDVEIHSALFRADQNRWLPETAIISRAEVQADLHRYIRRLGNPVPVRDKQGKIWLFFVSTSIGGWSTSAVNLRTSLDEGQTWSPVQRLISGPFLNISTLVKTPPFFYRDGTLGVPVYHELFAKYGEILRLDRSGKLIEKQRLNANWRTLQPLMLIENGRRATALMRYGQRARPRRAIQVFTEDAGAHWSEAVASELPNPDSAIAGLSLGDGRMLAVINNNQDQRDDLTLVVSDDGGLQWRKSFVFEDEKSARGYRFKPGEYATGLQRLFFKTDPRTDISTQRVNAVEEVMCDGHSCRYQFDYPYLLLAGNGIFHLFYTWNRTYIKHVEFNHAWLNQRIEENNQ